MNGKPRKRWWPNSKMTAVIITGVIYTWFIWVLTTWYAAPLEAWVVAANQTWILGAIGWSITERNGTEWRS